MNKTYLIFRHEFLLTIRRAGYIIMTLAVPVLTLLAIGIIYLATSLSDPPETQVLRMGYVDEAGIVDEQTTQGPISIVPYASREMANQALTSLEISTYFVIPANYLSSGIIQRYTLEKELSTPPATIAVIKGFLTGNLLKDKVEPEVVSLVVSPLRMEVTRITEQGEQVLKQSNIGNVIIPAVFSLLLSLALMFGVSSLISSLGEEKESRLIEVLFSSVSIRQLLISKVMALGTAGLLQVLIWLISAPLLLGLASSTFGGFFSSIEIPGNFILLGMIYFILGYLLFAVLSIGVGAITPSAREGHQLSMFFIMLVFVPLWFSSLLFAFPNSAVWVVFTVFPITAPIQTMLRLGVSDVPLWQILVSVGVLAISIVLGLFLSIRVFRMYMLIHGKRPGLRTIIQTLRNT